MKVLTFVSLLCLVSTGFCQQNLVQLAEQLGAKTLVDLVTQAGLADTLATGGPFTVFGPTDEAFTKLPRFIVEKLKQNKTLLGEVLKYHVVSGKVYSSQLSNELQAASLVDGAKIRINIYQDGKVVTAEGSPVVKVDQNATNGVIHVIDRVMFPLPIDNMVDRVKKDPELKTLLTAVSAAGLADALAADGLTLFAPTDRAFKNLPAGTLDGLLKNKTALTDVLTYHVVKGTDFSAGLVDGEKVATLEGKDITFKAEKGGVMVDNARVLRPDDAVKNGVIHIINSVLIPPQYRHLHFRP